MVQGVYGWIMELMLLFGESGITLVFMSVLL